MTASGRGRGHVTLVGAGPGDPQLLTLTGARALALADVVLYDRLIDERILAMTSPAARLIPVGKHKGGGMSQCDINALLVAEASSGAHVVRLKGGDPFLFGRGSEEIDALEEHGITTTVIPGVSSALAAPSAAGIPVTHRRVARACTIVSGHLADDDDYDWNALARSTGDAGRVDGSRYGRRRRSTLARWRTVGVRTRRRHPRRDDLPATSGSDDAGRSRARRLAVRLTIYHRHRPDRRPRQPRRRAHRSGREPSPSCRRTCSPW